MKAITYIILIALCVSPLTACTLSTQEDEDKQAVNRQQEQYAARQPIPSFDFSVERKLVTELYQLRNSRVATHSLWRSDMGQIEDDCPSIGYGIPYDTSLTNPLQVDWGHSSSGVIEQAEPNGLYASKNTSATWVMCVGENGTIDPVYVESKVTVYPYPITIDHATNRVKKAGKSTAPIPIE